MWKRNTLLLMVEFENKYDPANTTKDTFEKILLVFQLLLANNLMHV